MVFFGSETSDLRHETHDFFTAKKCQEKSQKVPKNANDLLMSAKKCRKVSKRRDIIILVLISAYPDKVSVSRMQDFFYKVFNITNNIC